MRALALDREVRALEKQNRELKAGAKPTGPNWREMAGPLIGTGVFGGLTAAILVFGWGWGWALGGIVLTACSVLLLIGSSTEPTGLPRGAFPVRCDLEVESAEGEVIPVRIIAIVRVAHDGERGTNAVELYGGRTIEDVGAAATALFESIVRAQLYRKPRAELEQATILDLHTPVGWFEDAFFRMALVVDSLWVGPA